VDQAYNRKSACQELDGLTGTWKQFCNPQTRPAKRVPLDAGPQQRFSPVVSLVAIMPFLLQLLQKPVLFQFIAFPVLPI
jgi:hypothetical protein